MGGGNCSSVPTGPLLPRAPQRRPAERRWHRQAGHSQRLSGADAFSKRTNACLQPLCIRPKARPTPQPFGSRRLQPEVSLLHLPALPSPGLAGTGLGPSGWALARREDQGQGPPPEF